MEILEKEFVSFVSAYMWPFFRIAAAIGVMPFFGTKIVPVRVRIGLSFTIAIIVAPLVPMDIDVDPFSIAGMLITISQVLIGVAMGMAIRLVFSALETGGHVIGQTMGLGFAQMVDPANGITVPVVSQLYTIMATLIFLAINGHLILINVIVESFSVIPVSAATLSTAGMWTLLSWSSWIFTGAVIIALPAVTALLIVNIAFGVMMKAAPQLNIFAVGFPLTLTLGFVFILATLPIFIPQFSGLFDGSLTMISSMLSAR